MSRKIFLMSFFEKSQSCACGGEREREGTHGLITAPHRSWTIRDHRRASETLTGRGLRKVAEKHAKKEKMGNYFASESLYL
jgi:hypothetical protein